MFCIILVHDESFETPQLIGMDPGGAHRKESMKLVPTYVSVFYVFW